jgi:hypothetical protein
VAAATTAAKAAHPPISVSNVLVMMIASIVAPIIIVEPLNFSKVHGSVSRKSFISNSLEQYRIEIS